MRPDAPEGASRRGSPGPAARARPWPTTSTEAASTVAGAAPAEPAAEATEAAEEEDDLVLADHYIDSLLCTSCNDCITLNNRLFRYNADKDHSPLHALLYLIYGSEA